MKYIVTGPYTRFDKDGKREAFEVGDKISPTAHELSVFSDKFKLLNPTVDVLPENGSNSGSDELQRLYEEQVAQNIELAEILQIKDAEIARLNALVPDPYGAPPGGEAENGDEDVPPDPYGAPPGGEAEKTKQRRVSTSKKAV